MRPKVKLLITVWGERHIARFCALSLPSLLAPGNLPALSAGSDLEVLVMIPTGQCVLMESQQAFRRLREVCPVRFVPIDDLIGSRIYGVTLTLAYARGIISCGDDAVNTHFVFMNADFIVADGSLRCLLSHIDAGQSVILAPSFRAVTENIEGQLLDAVNKAGSVLSISPRDLVRIALKHPHPTNIAKTVNQSFYHTIHPNQFFWWVDERTVLGRHYLMFMLCLRPERIIAKVNSYCDYGFVPAMCPSSEIVVLGDSDDVFMLELEPRRSESHLLRLGRQSVAEAARSLSDWTTIEHRRTAQQDIVIHAADLPPRIESVRTEADQFIRQLERHLREPLPYRHHPYWISGVEVWRHDRRQQSLSDEVWEIDEGIPLLARWRHFFRTGILKWSEWLVFGTPPFVRPWHYDWHDYREVRSRLAQALRSADAKVLVIRDETCPFDNLLSAQDPRIERIDLEDALQSRNGPGPGPRMRFSHCFCYLRPAHLRYVRTILERTSSQLSQGAEMTIFVANLSNVSNETMNSVGFVLPSWRYTISLSFAGGPVNHFVRRAVAALVSPVRETSLKVLLVGPALGLLLGLSALNNLCAVWWKRRPGRVTRRVTRCSSLVIRVTDKSNA